MNKKILIPIIVILIVAAGIGAYFVFYNPAPQLQANGMPPGQQTDVVKCMQDCMKEGKQPSECESECGATSKQPPTGGTAQDKCGDGICDEVEKANPDLCLEDCE